MRDVEFVQENGPEIVEDKQTIFAAARHARAARCDAGVLDLGHHGLALHRDAAGPGALPRRPSRQSAASGAGGRAVRRAVDLARRRSSARATSIARSARCRSRSTARSTASS